MSNYCTETETHKSRKVRKCEWCWERIEVGEMYKRYRCYSDEGASTIKMHPECYEAMQEEALSEGGWIEWIPGQERPKTVMN